MANIYSPHKTTFSSIRARLTEPCMLKFKVSSSKNDTSEGSEFLKNRRPCPKIDAKQFIERKILQDAWNKSVDKVIAAAMSDRLHWK